MVRNKSWARVALVGGVLSVGVLGARFGRLGGRAVGDNGGGFTCGAPPEVSATKGDASAEVEAGMAVTVHEHMMPKPPIHRGLLLLHAHPRFGGSHALKGATEETHARSVVARPLGQ